MHAVTDGVALVACSIEHVDILQQAITASSHCHAQRFCAPQHTAVGSM